MAEYRRFFVPKTAFCDGKITLDGTEFVHLKKVLRMRAGDRVVVCFDDGLDRLCEIESIGEGHALLNVVSVAENQAESKTAVTLYQALMKGDKMDFCVQKAVELGVIAVVPFESEFTVAKWDGKKTERYKRIAFEAAKQCGRAKLTTIKNCLRFCDLPLALAKHKIVVFCNEAEREHKILTEISKISSPEDIAVVIGGEGGFSDKEREAISALGNVVSVSFGKRILRAETASVFALSVISAWLDSLTEGR